jgi:cytosine/uracil/thiamine/allantoin permease
MGAMRTAGASGNCIYSNTYNIFIDEPDSRIIIFTRRSSKANKQIYRWYLPVLLLLCCYVAIIAITTNEALHHKPQAIMSQNDNFSSKPYHK